MIICKEIQDYIEYVENHKAWINQDRRLLIKNVVKPLLKRDDIFFDSGTFHNCIKYCEANFYPLFPFQKFIYAFVFMYWQGSDEFPDDTPVFRKFLILEGRGNGKDGFVMPLASFMQTPLYGVKDYHVDIVANSEDQAKDTFKVVWNMLEANPKKFKGKFNWTRELITNKVTGSELKFNTSTAGTKDGKKIGLLIFNELHAYENYDQINVFESAQGKIRHPREIIITTQGYVRDGPLDDILTMCKEILKTGQNDLWYFPFLCRLDKAEEVDDEEAWHKANPALEFMPILASELKMQYREMKVLTSKRAEFMTKHMNLPASKQEATVTSWDNILLACYKDIDRSELRPTPDTSGNYAIVGIDYADIRDFASAGVLTKTDAGEYIWRQHTWINAQSPYFDGIKFPLTNIGQPEFDDFEIVDAPVIPVDAVIDWIEKKYLSKYVVRKIAMDTYRYTLFKQEFINRGISIENRKDNPDGLVRLIRKLGSATGVIAPFIEQEFAMHNINFGASAIMRWYTNNTSVITDKYGNKQFGKIEPYFRKTDGFMAFDVAMFCKDELEIRTIYI